MRLCAPFSGVFCVVSSLKSPHYFPKRTVRSFAENSERKARDSKDEEAIFEGASDRNPWAFLRSRSFSLTIELLCSKILSIEFLSSAQNALREE